MMRKFRTNNKGVSTIIAAALIVALTVVIAVALGSTVLQVSTPDKLPSLQIKGEASATGDVVLTFLGGDPVTLDNVKISTYIPSGMYQGMQYDVPPADYSPASGVFDAGDVITMAFDDAFATSTYGPMAPGAGEQFTITLYTENQPIASATIIIQP
ncbi:MAG: type IV pilin N-terminal domain-containing protein [Candidatus Bathyarchaeia archaeon]|jgi:FlaG/FlaF family flagellin (archaellin)